MKDQCKLLDIVEINSVIIIVILLLLLKIAHEYE